MYNWYHVFTGVFLDTGRFIYKLTAEIPVYDVYNLKEVVQSSQLQPETTLMTTQLSISNWKNTWHVILRAAKKLRLAALFSFDYTIYTQENWC